MSSRSLRRVVGRVVQIEQATHDIRLLRLAIEGGAPFPFQAGQYVRLSFSDLPARDYSMANPPGTDFLEFHIRDVGDGASRYVATRLSLGERVTVEGPLGEAHFRPEHEGPILALAGGSGLAPVKSIVETALMLPRSQAVNLYFGARTERDIYLERLFRRLEAMHARFRFVPVLSDADAPTARRRGLVSDAVAADFDSLAGFKAYLAGPPAMVEAAVQLLRARGMPEADIHADPFYSDEENRLRRGLA